MYYSIIMLDITHCLKYTIFVCVRTTPKVEVQLIRRSFVFIRSLEKSRALSQANYIW
jgi:hypothetical protein